MVKLGWSEAHFGELSRMRERDIGLAAAPTAGSFDFLIGKIAIGWAWNPF